MSSFEHNLAVRADPTKLYETSSRLCALAPSWVDQEPLEQGLVEALSNAIVHGTLGVQSTGRSRNLASYSRAAKQAAVDRSEEIFVRAGSPNSRSFKVRIEWQGTPCPENKRVPQDVGNPLKTGGGMGLPIIYASFSLVEWDADGFAITLWTTRGNEQ